MKFILAGAITLVIMFAISFAIDDPQQAHSTRVASVIAGAVIAAIPTYSIERMSLLKRSLIHFAVMVAVVLPCLFLSGWYDWQTLPGFLALIGSFIGFGVAGWLIGYAISWFIDRSKNKISE